MATERQKRETEQARTGARGTARAAGPSGRPTRDAQLPADAVDRPRSGGAAASAEAEHPVEHPLERPALADPVDPPTLLEALLAISHLGIAVADRQLRLTRVNQAFARITGLAVEAHRGRTVQEVLGGLAAAAEVDLERVLQTAEPLLDRRVSGVVRAGEAGGWTPPADSGTVSDEGRRYARVSYLPLRQRQAGVEPGAVCGVLAVIAETTTRVRAGAERERAVRQARIALAEAERTTAELQAIIESMPDGVYIGTTEGLTLINQRGLDLLGASSVEELQGAMGEISARLQNRDASSGRRLAADEQPFGRALSGVASVREVLLNRLSDGAERVVRSAAAPIVVDGRITGAVAVNSDVTAMVRQRDAKSLLAEAGHLLASSPDHLRALQEIVERLVPRIADVVTIQVRAENGSYRQVAAAHAVPSERPLLDDLATVMARYATSARGLPARALTKRRALLLDPVPATLVDGIGGDAEGDALRGVLQRVGPRSAIAAPLVAHGEPFGLLLAATTRPDRRLDEVDRQLFEELAARAALAIDAARLHAAEQRARSAAEAASHAKSVFLATMSHEIRTPINAIMGYAELLEMGLSGPMTEGQIQQLGRIRASSRHLLSLVNDVLDLAKVESGRMLVHREAADAPASVAGALTLVHPQAAARQILLADLCPDGALVRYMGDPQRVEQILVNLVANAIRFTEPGGRVTLSCDLVATPVARAAGAQLAIGTECCCALRVEDTGIGIEPEHQATIFEPFVQVESGHTRTREGSGLGLAISRRLARLMSGDLTLESTPGQGSRFTLWLPGVPHVGDASAVPAADSCTIPERRDASRTAQGLTQVSEYLLRSIDSIVSRYVELVRTHPDIPSARNLNDAELRDHTATLLSDILQSLAIVEESGGAPTPLMRDSSEIQRVIADRHGRLRRQLGYSLAELRRERALLRDELLHRARRLDPGTPGLSEAIALVETLLARAEMTAEGGFESG